MIHPVVRRVNSIATSTGIDQHDHVDRRVGEAAVREQPLLGQDVDHRRDQQRRRSAMSAAKKPVGGSVPAGSAPSGRSGRRAGRSSRSAANCGHTSERSVQKVLYQRWPRRDGDADNQNTRWPSRPRRSRVFSAATITAEPTGRASASAGAWVSVMSSGPLRALKGTGGGRGGGRPRPLAHGRRRSGIVRPASS